MLPEQEGEHWQANVHKSTPTPASMVHVEGGNFSMGDTLGEGSSYERPVHTVSVRSFYIGKYEVTFDEYDAFCENTGRVKPWIMAGGGATGL